MGQYLLYRDLNYEHLFSRSFRKVYQDSGLGAHARGTLGLGGYGLGVGIRGSRSAMLGTLTEVAGFSGRRML